MASNCALIREGSVRNFVWEATMVCFNVITKYICMEELRKTTNPPVGAAFLRLMLLNMKVLIN